MIHTCTQIPKNIPSFGQTGAKNIARTSDLSYGTAEWGLQLLYKGSWLWVRRTCLMAPPVLNTPNVRNCFIRDHDFRNILCASASMIAPRSGVRNCFIRIMTLAIFFAPPVLILLTSNKKPTAGSRCAKRSDLRGVQGLSILAFVSHQLKLNWACGYLRAFLWNQTFEAKIMKGIIPQYSLRLRTCLAISFAPPQKERMSQYPLSLVQRTKTRDQMSKEYCERILTGRSHLLGKENGVASNPSRMNLLHD